MNVIELTGAVVHPGIYEIPMGTPLREIVYRIGGGIRGGCELKALLIGGATGICVPPEMLDQEFDFEDLTGIDRRRIEVADASTCLVQLVIQCLSFAQAASCCDCVFCREGTAQLSVILNDVTNGKGKPDDLNLISELCEGMRVGGLCSLARSVSNPVTGLVKYFPGELEAHIKKKRCLASVCKKFISYNILPEKCDGCGLCLNNCPESAIAGKEGFIHVIDQDECTKCGRCIEVCPPKRSAVLKASGVKPRTPDEPIPVGAWNTGRV